MKTQSGFSFDQESITQKFNCIKSEVTSFHACSIDMVKSGKKSYEMRFKFAPPTDKKIMFNKILKKPASLNARYKFVF